MTLTAVFEDGETATASRTLTVYREIEAVVGGRDDALVAVDVSGTGQFDPTESLAVESLRFGAPTALAVGCGAPPVGSESRDGDLRVWFDEARTGLSDDDPWGRLAGQTTADLPVAGTADATDVGGSVSE